MMIVTPSHTNLIINRHTIQAYQRASLHQLLSLYTQYINSTTMPPYPLQGMNYTHTSTFLLIQLYTQKKYLNVMLYHVLKTLNTSNNIWNIQSRLNSCILCCLLNLSIFYKKVRLLRNLTIDTLKYSWNGKMLQVWMTLRNPASQLQFDMFSVKLKIKLLSVWE